ncbi:MAG: hypothetical protein ABFE02_08075 [Sulfuricella sp.]
MTAVQEQTIKTIIQQEGGIGAFFDAVKAAYVKDRQAAALAALQNAISVTVTDWAALAAHVQQANNITLYAAMDAVIAAWQARDASKLGPRLVELAAAVKAHLGM